MIKTNDKDLNRGDAKVSSEYKGLNAFSKNLTLYDLFVFDYLIELIVERYFLLCIGASRFLWSYLDFFGIRILPKIYYIKIYINYIDRNSLIQK